METNMDEEFICTNCNKSDMIEKIGNSYRCKRCGIRYIADDFADGDNPSDPQNDKHLIEEEPPPTFSLRGKLHA
jgi:DNA-directed RNA polymerase subunit RPC12/RpoP